MTRYKNAKDNLTRRIAISDMAKIEKVKRNICIQVEKITGNSYSLDYHKKNKKLIYC